MQKDYQYDEIDGIKEKTFLEDNGRGRSNNKSNKKAKILLVDDEPDVAFALKLGLEQNGFKVDIFTDAELALSSFSAGMYDLALLDIKMPQINGFELYERMKKVDSKVKVCFITAHNVYYESLKELFPGMDCDCYVKPIRIDELVRHVKKQID
ncbi:MAG: response regulator [Thermoproteota archaeon]|nr:response regulator [Thermoproteota archaeon]